MHEKKPHSVFDPTPGIPYAECEIPGCGEKFATRDSAHQHLGQFAREGQKPHYVRVLNEEREQRIEDEFDNLFENALFEIFDKFEEYIDKKHLSEHEFKMMLAHFQVGDLEDAWETFKE